MKPYGMKPYGMKSYGMSTYLAFSRYHFFLGIFFVLTRALFSCSPGDVSLVVCHEGDAAQYGIARLQEALGEAGYRVVISREPEDQGKALVIVAGLESDSYFADNPGFTMGDAVKEGFRIRSEGRRVSIAGSDENGLLYGCLELAEQISRSGGIPGSLDFSDHPEMVLRGTCIGLQKTEYLPGRAVYEYPLTRENFPWFYDKEQWIAYLDMMAENRFNALFLWNGHPFASLVRLEDYPFAVEVDEETFGLNEEIYGFLTREAGRRGIWVIQMFYNIIVSKPFADHYGLATQDRNRPIMPVISDYTRQSVAAFIGKYPHVGLMVCLGEAINTIEDDVEWFTQTIIPGVKDGLATLGVMEEPPLVLRGHDTDARRVMEAALPLYRNLYTVHKYNGESLTTYEPRDSWATIHQELSRLAPVHISNVHILANLEPFRYGSPVFIQKSVQAMHDIQGANGLHLYPQASYWDWPYTADNTTPRMMQACRDRIWYSAWGRYAWNCRRDRDEEVAYWATWLGDFYGCGARGKEILEAYEQSGEIAPKLLRRFGISDGNRQTLLLGMFMSQLVNPYKWNVYSNFYASSGPPGEILADYARKEWFGESHAGELPLQIIAETVEHGEKAAEAIERAAPHVKSNTAEFERLKNDMYCYRAFSGYFAERVRAAERVLRYKYSGDFSDLETAVPFLEKSVAYYQELVDLTSETYLYANSMQTQQRRIPAPGTGGINKTWGELLPQYQRELENFRHNIAMLKSAGGDTASAARILEPAQVTLLNQGVSLFPLKKGEKVYRDHPAVIEEAAPELQRLSGILLSDKAQQESGTMIHFRNEKAVKVLVGYFNTNSYSVLQPPTLETDASANDRGQADIKIANALKLNSLYPVNIYSYHFEAGENRLVLGKGRVLVLGFIDGSEEIEIHDAGLTDKTDGIPVDWLFY